MRIDKNTAELAAVGIIIAVTILLYWNTYSFLPSMLPGYPGDAFFPRIILASMLVCSIAALVEIIVPGARKTRHDDERRSVEINVTALGAVAGAVIVYAIALSYVGFEISTFAFVLALLTPALSGPKMFAFAKAAGIALVAVVVIYFCFVIFLDVDFPLLFLPRYIHF
jgi:putative tricarboxylic transport membrane protein